MSSHVNITPNQSEIDINNLRLLSINEARKVLGLRHETVKGLIEQGKLQALIIHNRIKIPIWSILEYQKTAAHKLRIIIGNNSEPESENDVLQRILNKNLI